jgi:hypothetical protein
MRFAMPFSIGDTKSLACIVAGVNTVPAPPDSSKTGLGDFVFAAYQMDVGIPKTVSASGR